MRNINPGIEVQGQYSGGATQELFTIGELDQVWVIGDLYEMDLARVQSAPPPRSRWSRTRARSSRARSTG